MERKKGAVAGNLRRDSGNERLLQFENSMGGQAKRGRGGVDGGEMAIRMRGLRAENIFERAVNAKVFMPVAGGMGSFRSRNLQAARGLGTRVGRKRRSRFG
ncbi:MAG: hypothetical protein INH43_06375 [Acidobacteriaceae bacterium]|nr:hypothetical protein [Acidobacteriaceae bacterium]